MDVSVLIMSSDGYSDCWYPFYKLYKKYWNPSYKTYLCSETKDCEYFETIKTQGSWTSRVRQALEQIDSKYVIFLLEDFFFHNIVNQDRIEFALKMFDKDTACVNFEQSYDMFDTETNIEDFKLRSNQRPYLCSCQPSIWNRERLIGYLQKDMTPHEWELQIVDTKYKHFINSGELIFDIGYYKERKPWCIVNGKISNDMIDLFEREGLDLPKREYLEKKPILSIIIPYYNTLELTKTLLDTLTPQLNDDVEVLLINDGSCIGNLDLFPIKVIHQANGGVSKTRNNGLDNYKGDYVVFIDSDDNVKPNYVEKILNKIKEEQFDHCFFSWERQDGSQVIIKDLPPTMNNSVWNCIYSRKAIGNNRFPENKQIGEEIEFNKATRTGKKANIEDILYIYNSGRDGSLSTEYRKGNIKEERQDEINTQVVVYRSFLSKIGGIESAVYNFCLSLKDKYDIVFIYDNIGEENMQQLYRLKKLVKCVVYNGQKIKCDRFIYYGVNPKTIDKTIETPNKKIQQICNDMLAYPTTFIPDTKDTEFYADSESSAKSFEKKFNVKCGVLHNLFNIQPNKCLMLCTASRLSWEKGYERMKDMAKRMKEKKIPFIWTVFTNDLPNEEIDGFIFMKPRLNVIDYMAKMDYVIQLSDFESWGCTITEALECGAPVISTDFPSAYEQIEDGTNGFILQRDLRNLDEVIDKMYNTNLKGFKYTQKYSIKEWTDTIGELGKPKSDYVYNQNENIGFRAKVLKGCYYAVEQQQCKEGNILTIGTEERLKYLEKLGYVKRMDDSYGM
jgi:glycosyltransferase involved in cell wall biosynthesis